jgi:hypothetical protein
VFIKVTNNKYIISDVLLSISSKLSDISSKLLSIPGKLLGIPGKLLGIPGKLLSILSKLSGITWLHLVSWLMKSSEVIVYLVSCWVKL